MNYRHNVDEIMTKKLLQSLMERNEWRENFVNILKSNTRNVYIWGTGQVAQHFYHDMRVLGGVFQGFVDNNKELHGKEICDGLLCINPEELCNIENLLIVVGVGMHSREVFIQLEQMGIKEALDATAFLMNYSFTKAEDYSMDDVCSKINKVFSCLGDEKSAKVLYRRIQDYVDFNIELSRPTYFYDIYEPNQYFIKDLITFSPQDVLVDCGAYDGDTLRDFLRLNKPFAKYIMYELSKKNCDKIIDFTQRYTGGGKQLLAVNAGVGDVNEEIYYDDNISATTYSSSGTKGQLVRLSDDLCKEQVTFIKMDIEGAEMSALRGAAELIKRCKPKLAICVYHKLEDLWEIPLYIKSLNEDYKIYLRHHTPLYLETVCYAIPKI